MNKLMVKNGTYKTNSGEEKANWTQVGFTGEGKYGKFMAVYPHINFSAFSEDGKPVFISEFEDKPKDEDSAIQPIQTDVIDDDIPF